MLNILELQLYTTTCICTINDKTSMFSCSDEWLKALKFRDLHSITTEDEMLNKMVGLQVKIKIQQEACGWLDFIHLAFLSICRTALWRFRKLKFCQHKNN